MRFLIDAQLPRRLSAWLIDCGIDSIHTLDLPFRNRTPDSVINELSVTDKRILITKDVDFVNSFLLNARPWKLLLISTGNISNIELERLISSNIEKITSAFESEAEFVELNRTTVVVHR